MYNLSDFEEVKTTEGAIGYSKGPRMTYNNEDKRVSINSKAVRVLPAKYVKLYRHKTEPNIIMMKACEASEGDKMVFYAEFAEKTGRTWSYPGLIDILENTDVVKSEDKKGKFYFEGVLDEGNKALVFDLNEGYYVGAVIRNGETLAKKHMTPERSKP